MENIKLTKGLDVGKNVKLTKNRATRASLSVTVREGRVDIISQEREREMDVSTKYHKYSVALRAQ